MTIEGVLRAGLATIAAASMMASPAIATEPSAWAPVKGAPPAISLGETSFAGLPTASTAYAHVNGSRSDWVRSGTLALAAPNLTIMISRLTDPKPVVKSVIGALEELNEIKLSQHRYRPTYYAMTTKFGELRGVTFEVDADGIRKYCVGFHKPATDAVFVKGYVCGTESANTTPQDVSCLIDKIRYVDAPVTDTASTPLPACGATRLDPDSSSASPAIARPDRL